MTKDETLSEALARLERMLWHRDNLSFRESAEFQRIIEKVAELENESVFVRRHVALGVRAIVFLQKIAGIVETEEEARTGWAGMSERERESTLVAYEALGGVKEETT